MSDPVDSYPVVWSILYLEDDSIIANADSVAPSRSADSLTPRRSWIIFKRQNSLPNTDEHRVGEAI